MKKNIKIFINVAWNLGLSVLIFLGLFFYSKNVFPEKSTSTCLCDAAFVCGIIFLCWTGLAFVSSKGAFSSISFAIQNLFTKIKDPKHKNKESKTYAEYVKEKSAESKKRFFIPLAVGGIMLAVSFLFLAKS